MHWHLCAIYYYFHDYNYVNQVLSESVAKALPLVVGQKAAETAEFVLLFDKFFDVLNVTNFTSGATSRKPFLHPYRSRDDERLKVLQELLFASYSWYITFVLIIVAGGDIPSIFGQLGEAC